MSYTTPPITTATSYGAMETYSALQSAPALLTRFTPPEHCSTDWYWDTGVLRSSSTAFSNLAHNTQWNTCQPYNQTRATYSAGICPERSEFKSVTQVSWDGVSQSYYVGACCASTAVYQTYKSGDVTSLGCVVTATQSTIVATWVQENYEPTAVTSNGPITIIADPLYMVWHEADVSLHPESDAGSLLAAMGMPTTTASSAVPTSTVYNITTTVNASWTAGEIAGVVVGFTLCLVAIGILSYFLVRRRKKVKEASLKQVEHSESPDSTNAWESRPIYGSHLQIQTNSINKSPSFVEAHPPDSSGSRTPQTPHMPHILGRPKDEELYAIEQKTLLR